MTFIKLEVGAEGNTCGRCKYLVKQPVGLSGEWYLKCVVFKTQGDDQSLVVKRAKACADLDLIDVQERAAELESALRDLRTDIANLRTAENSKIISKCLLRIGSVVS